MALLESNSQTHFVPFPFLAPGHTIPMIDIARKLARRGLIVTVFMTARNADRFLTGLDRSVLRLAELRFPSADVGLPEGCESLDTLPEPGMIGEFMRGLDMLQQPAEELSGQLHPRPCCIISDMYFPWTLQIANKFRIPRITFSGVSNFFLVCVERLLQSDLMETVESDSDYFSIPGLPDRVEFTKDQLTYVQLLRNTPEAPLRQMALADEASYGAIVNSFEELEPGYVEEYNKARKGKAWCVGPVSLNKAGTYEEEWFKWLDSWPGGSVVYACMGSINILIAAQVKELGLGLEASNKPFVWVVRGGEGVEKWIKEDGFEERVKGRGLLIRGWDTLASCGRRILDALRVELDPRGGFRRLAFDHLAHVRRSIREPEVGGTSARDWSWCWG